MIKTIYLAGGCFWGTAHLMSLVPGVNNVVAGYANSLIPNPSYEMVCSGRTNAAEAVKVTYDDSSVSLTDLLQLYFKSIDPLSINRQGNDMGSQYRTGVYYADGADAEVIDAQLATLQRRYKQPLAIEFGPLQNFYPAEEYHQAYLIKNPNGYCHVSPELFSEARAMKVRASLSKDELRQRLTPLQWEVTQNGATERPFVNEYDDEFRPGIYVDITDGTPLFLSSRKYNSGCGWPAFSKPVSEDSVVELPDYSYGRTRTEVRSAKSGSHLGHVFNDGPVSDGGLRYCINSAALRFIPKAEMEAEGYGEYLSLIEE